MNQLMKELEKEMQQMNKIVLECEKTMERAPSGRLRIANHGGKPQYFHMDEKQNRKSPQGKYIKKEDFFLVKALAQKDYDKKLLRAAAKQIKAMEKFKTQYDPDCLLRIKQEQSQSRMQLIDQRILDEEEYVKEWLAKEYQGRDFVKGTRCYYTENSEKVRSKSEKMIADKLLLMGIPYRYECPVYMSTINREFYPDFTLLEKKTRKEYYLEHFGMMDDPEYLDNFMEKLECYSENGIYLGKNLLVTFETQEKPLNIRILERELEGIFDLQ